MGARLTPDEIARFLGFWRDEMATARLYRDLAEHAGDRRDVFLALADTEERHAGHWADLLAEADVDELTPPQRDLRNRILVVLARLFGVEVVLPVVIRAEASDANRYRDIPQATATMAEEEVAHGRALAAVGGITTAGGRIAAAEGRHRTGAGGALRAAVFGVNDGLVSNFSLIMGVAGGAQDPDVVVLAGVAGLFAGAFSMAAGEWVSVRSQTELYLREMEIEREEIARFPEEEAEELELIFRAKGMEPADAEEVAARLMSDPDAALDTLAREELGIDPTDLPSPWVAAVASFAAFAVGAAVPVVPFAFGAGRAAVVAAAIASLAALFSVGAVLSVFTARPAVRSGLRMVAVGAAAAAATFLIGTLVGVTVS